MDRADLGDDAAWSTRDARLLELASESAQTGGTEYGDQEYAESCHSASPACPLIPWI